MIENPFAILERRLNRLEDLLLSIQQGLNSNSSTIVDRPLSVDQATSFTGLAKQTLYQMASRGEVPCSRRGKRLIFLESELIQWIKDGRKGGSR